MADAIGGRAELARTARELAAEWGIELGEPFAPSRYSYVAPAGVEAVLKVASRADDESAQEVDALELWDGDGAVRLLRADRERRALLLERARPGTDLAELAEDAATAVAVGVAGRLWRPAARPFRWIGDQVPGWLDRARPAGPAGLELVELARRLYAELEPGHSTLVHGDLHHHNLLDAGGRHLAIDPKPMLGEPEYDVPSFLWNPLDAPMTPERTERRLAAFAAAGLDQRRMRAWTVIRGTYLVDDEDELGLIRGLVA